MKLSELIKLLQSKLEIHGDAIVYPHTFDADNTMVSDMDFTGELVWRERTQTYELILSADEVNNDN